jgi:multidrug efflux pump subunit AcrB
VFIPVLLMGGIVGACSAIAITIAVAIWFYCFAALTSMQKARAEGP